MSSYNNYSEDILLRKLKENDQQAFAELFYRFHDKLYYYILKHTKSSGIAEEIVNDIFMKLWIGRDLTEKIPNLGAFLFKVGFYKAMDFLKTTARRRKLKQLYINQYFSVDSVKKADEILIDEEERILLIRAVNQLPPKRALIYRLSREDGLTHEQIANALNLSRNTVKNTIMAATSSISNYLHTHYSGRAAFTSLFFLT